MSTLECVHDRLHIYPPCEMFYFPWHRHQIEGTNGFSVSSERHIYTQSLMLRGSVLRLIFNMPGPGMEPRSPACQTGVLNPQSHRAYDQVTTYLRPKHVGIVGKS